MRVSATWPQRTRPQSPPARLLLDKIHLGLACRGLLQHAVSGAAKRHRHGIGSSVVFLTVRIATLEFTRATPGSRVSDSLCTRSKSAMSETTTRSR